MLTDIFAERYRGREIWNVIGDSEKRLLVQAFQLISKEVVPFHFADGKVRTDSEARWTRAADLLMRELGLRELAPGGFWSSWGSTGQTWFPRNVHAVCEAFMQGEGNKTESPDRFMKERLSFVELIFRDRHGEIQLANASLDLEVAKARGAAQRRAFPGSGMRVPGDPGDGLIARNRLMNQTFERQTEELNERFRRAGAPLRYHNGFIQLSLDEAAEEQIGKPFWASILGEEWQNVRHDMSEAIDLRDTDGRDPAFYAARALESTIKILCDKFGWTTGKEKGAFNYIDNLAGAKFIEPWEKESLQIVFRHVRNPLGHGPGSGEMPELRPWQTDWAIESCMSWVKSLVRRQS